MFLDLTFVGLLEGLHERLPKIEGYVIMTDAVFDASNCFAYEEAENRLHTQKAIMSALIGGG